MTPPLTTTTRPHMPSIEQRRWPIPLSLTMLAVGTAGALPLHLVHRHGQTVLIGPITGQYLTILAGILAVAGTGGLLLVLAWQLTTRDNTWARTGGTLLILAVPAAWILAAVAAVLAYVLASTGTWVHLDTPGTTNRWVVHEMAAIGDSSYTLYSGNGLLFTRHSDLPGGAGNWEPFTTARYTVTDDGGQIVLRYPRGPGALPGDPVALE